MSTVGLAGDWHGNVNWAVGRILSLASRHGIDRILHLGDFGIWPGPRGREYLDTVDKVAHRNGVFVYVTPGNHEDYGQIGDLVTGASVDDPHQIGKVGWIRSHIAILPRGHRWAWEGRTFLSLGGAPSIDRDYRMLGRDWWAEEAITDADVAKAAEGGHAEVMLAHDAPNGSTHAVRSIIADKGGWSDRALAYAARGRDAMDAAFAAVQPDLFVHGHYHVYDDCVIPKREVGLRAGEGYTRFVALACDGMAHNTALLDLDTMQVAAA